MEYTEIQDMLDFITASPTSFQAVEQLKARLAEAGYEEQVESAAWTLTPGGRYFTIRNHSSLLAWQMPETLDQLSFNIVASHSDAPTFKLKPNAVICENGYLKLNTEGYGGMLCSTWMDRPLGLAGRVIVREGEQIVSRYLNIERPLLTIPSLAIHMNREANTIGSKAQDAEMARIVVELKSEIEKVREQIQNIE